MENVSNENGQNNNQIVLKANLDSANNSVEEEMSEFASGLPGWDLLPPQVIVRRVKRNI